jgi:glutathione peroxidase-family protein
MKWVNFSPVLLNISWNFTEYLVEQKTRLGTY